MSREEVQQMSGPDEVAANRPREKTDEDDHDLLTFAEVGERLRIEIAKLTALCQGLKASGDATGLREAERRLDALRVAASRNTSQPINDANFERFFGYRGRAKRNVQPPPPGGEE
jgi:hypothetical protein